MKPEQLEAIFKRSALTSGNWLADYLKLKNANIVLTDDVPALLAEVGRLRKALEFYGNHGWVDGVVETVEGDRYKDAPPIFYDCGKIARTVLDGGAYNANEEIR